MAARKTPQPLRPGTTAWGKMRVAAKLSQREAARLSGVPQATISLMESGRLIPKPSEAEKLIELYRSRETV